MLHLSHEIGGESGEGGIRALAQVAHEDGAGQPRVRAGPGAGRGRALLPVDAQGEGQNRLGRPLQGAVRGDAPSDRQLAGRPAHTQAHGTDLARDNLLFDARHKTAQASYQEGVSLILAPFLPVPLLLPLILPVSGAVPRPALQLFGLSTIQ